MFDVYRSAGFVGFVVELRVVFVHFGVFWVIKAVSAGPIRQSSLGGSVSMQNEDKMGG